MVMQSSVLLLALLAVSCEGHRVQADASTSLGHVEHEVSPTGLLQAVGSESEGSKGPFADPDDLVCGSRQIRTMLSEDHRNIPWTNIFEISDTFTQTKTETIQKIKKDMSLIEGRIERAEAHESLKALDPAAVQKAISDSVGSSPTCGNVEDVQKSACGSLQYPRVNEQCWVDAPAEFFKSISKLMSSNGFVEKAIVATACKGIFSSEDCSDFCNDIVAEASRATSELVGATHRSGHGSDELRSERETLKNSLNYQQKELEECATMKETLKSFETTLTPLQKVIKVRVVEERKAKNKMWNAEDILKQMVIDVTEQDAEFARADKLMAQAGKAAGAAHAVFQKATGHTADVTQKHAKAIQELNAGNDWQAKAMHATKAAEDVQLMVVRVLMDMLLFYDEAVRKPLRNLGVNNTTNFAASFPKTTSLASRADLLKSLLEFKGLCSAKDTTEALSVEEPKAYKVDSVGKVMRPPPSQHFASRLCSELNDNVDGDMNKVVKNVEDEVSVRTDRLVEQFTGIQSWLLSTRFVKADRLAKADSAGEIDHLREVMSVMGSTDIYKKYLTHWRFDQVLAKSIGRLDAVLERANQRVLKVTEEFGALTKVLEKANVDKAKAQEKLSKAIDSKEISADKMQEARQVLNELETHRQFFESRLDGLTEAWKQATAALEGSKEKLQRAHAQTLSLAELFSVQENDADADE